MRGCIVGLLEKVSRESASLAYFSFLSNEFFSIECFQKPNDLFARCDFNFKNWLIAELLFFLISINSLPIKTALAVVIKLEDIGSRMKAYSLKIVEL